VLFDFENSEYHELASRRILTENTHGTGCSLSSALAAFLAKGLSLTEAAQLAKNYIADTIEAGKDYEIGQGHGPVHHFYKFWK